MVVCPGGERHWVDLTSSALKEETAGHLTAMRTLPSPGNPSLYIIIYCTLVYWCILAILSGVAVPLFLMEATLPALSVCASSATCSLAQDTSLCFTAWQNLP